MIIAFGQDLISQCLQTHRRAASLLILEVEHKQLAYYFKSSIMRDYYFYYFAGKHAQR